MRRIIAFFNQSGGVGKTTLTMNIGYHLAQHQHRVLLIDMDPQGSLTAFMGLEPFDLETTVYHALIQQQPLPLYTDLHGMTLAPSSIHLSRAEMELSSAIMREQRLKAALAPIEHDYDFILLDCPPSLGILSIMSLVTATHVLIPIQTEFKALKGTELLLTTIVEVMEVANRGLKIAGMVPTMYDARTSQAKQSLESIQKIAGQVGPVLPTVPRKTDFANAAQAREPLLTYAPQNPALSSLQAIAQILEAL